MMIKKGLFAAGLAGFIGIGVLGYNTLGITEAKQKAKVVEVHTNAIADFNDQKQVAGASHNIFIGEITKQIGNKSRGSIPETQYEVKVLKDIKGKQKNKIVLNQQGGYRENAEGQEELVLVEGDKLLQEGKLYLFATRYSEEDNWHTVIPNAGDILIDGEEKKNKLIKEFTAAYENQSVPEFFKKINENGKGKVFE